ncbi:GGDEF domain-containing protein [Modestobacter sp. NPDC049651]|uniref:GGDEF domain-containing protein n=1 Tax=unclassified Modestobacter TaxID=2643866 RepID=UPI0033C2D3F7
MTGPEAGDPALAAALVATTRVLVCVVGGDARIRLVNPAMERFTGRPADELVGALFTDVYVVPEHRALALDAVARSMATGTAHRQEGDWLAAGGVRRRVTMVNDVLVDDEGRPDAVVCLGLDVTDERAREAQLHHRAHTDLLTGVANRSTLFDELRRHLDGATGTGCGVLFCDLDRFKEVNDRFGHAVGDRVLVGAAERLRRAAGPEDLVARLGGDEFVVLCPRADPARLAELAERVTTEFGEPFRCAGTDLPLTASLGATVGRPGDDADAVLASADQAMYGVKSRHRRRAPRDGG